MHATSPLTQAMLLALLGGACAVPARAAEPPSDPVQPMWSVNGFGRTDTEAPGVVVVMCRPRRIRRGHRPRPALQIVPQACALLSLFRR